MAVRTGRKRAACARNRTSVVGHGVGGHHTGRGRNAVSLVRLLKSGRLRDGLLATSCLVIASAALPAAVSAQSLPQGGVVVGGSATITQTSPTQLTINQSTLRAVTNWNSFSIGTGNSVKIAQPGTSSVSVNQVVGPSASAIFGSLTSNGQVVVANPNGVWFGPGSHVDVAGLVATTATMSPASVSGFMAGGKLNFDTAGSPTASVVNDGTITIGSAGLAAFVAPGVANNGIIQARLGKVQLASGNTYTLDLNGDGLVQLAVSDKVLQQAMGPDGKPLSAAVVNSGQILADGGSVYLTANVAKNVVNNVIDMSGVIEARAATVAGGDIILSGGDGGQVAVSGTLDASGLGAGQTGGTVKVLGQNVALNAGASINVSGDAGGGTALIGGNFHGAGPEPNAQTTYVDAAAAVAADAVTYGNGGNVAVWADISTVFNGTITARGGTFGGDGGFVETSGKQFLTVDTGFVNTLAPLGRVGTWLLDPQDITIVATGGTATLGDVGSFGANPGASEQINAGTIMLAASNVVLQATDNITFGALIAMQNNGVGLTAQAGNNIVVNAGTGITTRGGAITLSANDPASGAQTGTGSISIASALDATNGNTAAGAAVTLTTNNGGSITSSGFISSGAGAVAIAGNGVTLAGVTTSGQTIGVTSGGGMVLNGLLSTNGNGGLGGAINLTAGGNVGLGLNGSTLRTAGGTVTIDAGSVTSVAPGLNSPGISTSVVGVTGGVNGGAVTITTTTGGVSIGGTINTESSFGGTAGNVTIAAAGDVTLGAGLSNPTANSAVLAVGLGTSAAGQVAGNGGNVSISGGNISLLSSLSTFGGAATAAGSTSNGGNAGSITLNGTGAVTIGTAATGNLVGLNSGGGSSLNGAGGNAGAVSVSGNTIALDRVLASGGNTISVAGGGSNGAAGNGANVTLAATASSGNAITFYGNAESPTDTSSNTATSFITVSARSGLQGNSSATSIDGVLGGTGGSVTIGGAGGGMLAGSAIIRLMNDSSASSFNGGATVRIIAGGSAGNLNNGSVLINGPVEAATSNVESLRLHATNASLTVAGDIGGQTAVNSLVFGTGRATVGSEGSITLGGPVTAGTQVIDLRSSGSLTFNGLVTTPAFTLTAGTTAVAMNAGANFTGTVSGLSSVGSLILGGTFGFTGAGLSVDQTIPLTLSGPTTLNTPNGGITLAAVDGATTAGEALSLNAGGAVTLNGPLGGSISLGAVTVNGNSLFVGGNVTTAGQSIDLTSGSGGIITAGVLDTTGNGTASGGAVNLTANAGGNVTTSAGITAGSGTVTVSGTGVTLDGATTAGSTIALTSSGGGVVVNGALITNANNAMGGAVTLTATAGDNVTTNAGIVAGGPVTVSGNGLSINSVTTFGQAIDLTSGSAGIVVTGSSLFTNGNGALGGAINIAANAGGNVTVQGSLFAGGPVAIAGNGITTNDVVTLGSAISMTGGSGGIVAGPLITNANSTVGGAISLTANSGGSVTLNSDIISGAGAVTMSGSAVNVRGITTAGQNIELTGGSGGISAAGVLNTT
ncbi:MAG TPA: filamentous hemagglutinin N-terminal domain-containing protein, partial [Alphaproteobacteria bacterium]|nr:filamentous hemagglutinin N-terminal domain-containing protein [Alphaproteobacteria bacterium]